LLGTGACLTGCFGFLKPAPATARHFVLTPLPASQRVPLGSAPALGVAQVKLPAYLFDTSLAMRKGTNEITYLPSALWAERLDSGLQRVLAANLSALLPTDQVRLSAWRPQDVVSEIYVAVEQFDVDTAGHGTLAARWRIVMPGGERTLKAGDSRFTRQGPSPEADPSGAVATLSELAADLSRLLVQTIKELTPPLGATATR
jgi:uncharacterized lipoprotein YmbA